MQHSTGTGGLRTLCDKELNACSNVDPRYLCVLELIPASLTPHYSQITSRSSQIERRSSYETAPLFDTWIERPGDLARYQMAVEKDRGLRVYDLRLPCGHCNHENQPNERVMDWLSTTPMT